MLARMADDLRKLTKQRKAEIARLGAEARWNLPQAVCDGVITLGPAAISCAVLADGTRVLTQAEFLEALGRHRKANVRKEGGEERVPAILQGKAINPFISKDILEKSRPIKFRTTTGAWASGYRADLLPAVCEVYLKARDAEALPANQKHVAIQAEILIRALAHVGIIALVDEATGYQDVRARDELAQILQAFVATELRKWIRTFPVDYYKQICRLRGLPFPNGSQKFPSYFGHLTNNLVYSRLAPGVLAALRQKNPVVRPGHRKHKHFQWLTDDIGDPRLREHLSSLVALMKAADSWDQFCGMVDRALPPLPQYADLPLLAMMEAPTDEQAAAI